MSYYVSGSSLSYPDYLQAKSFESSFKSEIFKQTRSIIASNEELQQQHIAAIESVSSGIEQLSFDAQELTATFQWGFSELLTAVGRVNDALAELVKIAKTPAQTWAYEQFEVARDAFRQGLYQESLEYLERAINGYAGNTGHKLEYRFHYLLGTIRLGSFRNTSKDIVSLAEAENAFLRAARYAQHDHPKEAGRALLAAGWAAYCQGKMPEATQYSEQAISLVHDLAEGYFQVAKIKMHVGDPDSALQSGTSHRT
jgi:tetratricopeptide (TPR) repeat protein